MTSIPVDLQRKLDRRWAARFAKSAPAAALRLENQIQRFAAAAKVKKKAGLVKRTGLRSTRLV